jgi:alcohol dehydrogenase (cytochrome c)
MRIVLITGIFCSALFAIMAADVRPTLGSGSGYVNWPSDNDTVTSNRFASSTQITKSTVSTLHVVCSAALGQISRFQSGPIVVNGIIYVTSATQTYAINGTTCAILWTNSYAAGGAGGATNRGAAYANGVLFRGFSSGAVMAINASTGATIWTQNVLGSGSLEYVSAAPIVWKSSVVIGTANGDNGQMCHVMALDQSTGRIIWSDQLVPGVGTPDGKTWKGATRIAGGATWTSFSIDPATAKLYVPVGNPGPDFDSRLRKGANLYTNSVLELEPATGALVRGFQFVPQDVHDWDQASAPAIVTLANAQKVMLAAGKDGYLRSVSLASNTQLWKTAVTKIVNANAPITVKGTHYCPSGGVHWNGPSYSSTSGLVYVNAVNQCKTVTLSATPQPYVPGQAWLGTPNGYGVVDSTSSGFVTAVNAMTGAVVWQVPTATKLYAGITSTAGGVVFSADLNGTIYAFDDTTGTVLKTISTGEPLGGGLVSYAVNGTQYIAAAAGLNVPILGAPNGNSSIVVLGI